MPWYKACSSTASFRRRLSRSRDASSCPLRSPPSLPPLMMSPWPCAFSHSPYGHIRVSVLLLPCRKTNFCAEKCTPSEFPLRIPDRSVFRMIEIGASLSHVRPRCCNISQVEEGSLHCSRWGFPNKYRHSLVFESCSVHLLC